MKIKEALKQKKDFTSPVHEALVNLQFSASWLSQKTNDMVTPYGLSMQQFNVLRILRGNYPEAVTVKYIIERMIDKNSNASRLVDKLLAKELVERHQCPNDRRRVDVSISEKGLALLKKMDTSLKDMYKKIPLSEKEATELSILLDKLRSE